MDMKRGNLEDKKWRSEEEMKKKWRRVRKDKYVTECGVE